MERVVIDCGTIRTKEAFHAALSQALHFPAWYGGNLDALHDALTEIDEDIQLTLLHFDDMKNCRRGFLRVFTDAVEENLHLTVNFE